MLSPPSLLPPPLKRSNFREVLQNNLDSQGEADNKYKKPQGNNFLSLCEKAQSVNFLYVNRITLSEKSVHNVCTTFFFFLWVITYIGQ